MTSSERTLMADSCAESSPMPEATLTALRGSIEKWEAILAGTLEDQGAENCPLCRLFIETGCSGCPVKTATGRKYCIESPYDAWQEAIVEKVGNHRSARWIPVDQDTRVLAQAELDFLKSLLPPEVDPMPWCSGGHMTEASCTCGEIDSHD